MTVFIALLRAVNVGGTGKLPMAELKAMCETEGFGRVQTYIASGNVVFETERSDQDVQTVIAARLEAYAGGPVGVMVRTALTLASVLADNPFATAPGNRVVAIFLSEPPSPDCLDALRGRSTEEISLGTREIYVHYPEGMAKTKLIIPAAKSGTARNMNTVARLVAMAVSDPH